MINKENFKQELKNIPVKEFPADLKELHAFIIEATDNGTLWDAYEDLGIKPVMDHYFVKLNEFLKNNSNQVKPNTKIKEATKAKNPREKKKKVPQAKPEPIPAEEQSDISVEFVERIPEELKFIRRCLSFHGKKKTKEDLLRFINAIHRAIVEKRVRKTSPYATQLNYIQDKLVKKYNAMGNKAEAMVLKDSTVNEFKEIIASQKVLSSVTLIKRYISLNGKIGVKEKAKTLIASMKKAVDKGKVNKSDRYFKTYTKMLSKLNAYVKNKTQKILDIEEAELNGLNGILGNPNRQSEQDFGEEFSGLENKAKEKPDNSVMNSMDFKEMKFETLGFKGKYLGLIGDPSKGFSAMVFGRPKMGKSFLCIDFAGYLARNHGKVLYVAKEEGLDYTLQEKLKATDVAHPNLDVTGSIPNDLSKYDFVFLDSVNKLELSTHDLESLKNKYAGTSFIQIFQTTKAGTHKGNSANQHNVDVVIEVPEKGKAIQFGRFNQGGEMDIFQNDQAAGLEGKPKSSNTLKDKILYDILSPDGFTIRMPDNALFKTRDEGIEYFKKWMKRFEVQGYYSSNSGRIPLIDLQEECTWEEVLASQADSWLGFRAR